MFEARATLILIAVGCLTAGCARHNSGPATSGEVGVEALKSFQPESGGEMVLLPAGSFTLGDAGGRPDESPHQVSIDSFYLDKFPVTQELYEKVMGVNPSKRKGKKNPVERTQWTHAGRFCNNCSELYHL